jgi:hypothetical protein
VTSDADAPALPFWQWAQVWARLLTFWPLAGLVALEVMILASANASAFGIIWVVVSTVVLAPSIWFCARCAFLHVRAAPEGVRVFNPLHTYNVRWDEIQSVEAVDQDGGIGGYARIIKTDGEQITLAVSNFGIRGDPTSALRIATPLGKAFDRQRARAASVR